MSFSLRHRSISSNISFSHKLETLTLFDNCLTLPVTFFMSWDYIGFFPFLKEMFFHWLNINSKSLKVDLLQVLRNFLCWSYQHSELHFYLIFTIFLIPLLEEWKKKVSRQLIILALMKVVLNRTPLSSILKFLSNQY